MPQAAVERRLAAPAADLIPDRLKPALRTIRFAYRRLGANWRVLPDFIIAGAQKAGTTSLFRYLADHPMVRPALGKEVHYFDNNFGRGAAWYRAHFPIRAALSQRPEADQSGMPISGEASPYYLDHPHAPARCFAALPHARIIFLLRDPVQRAQSHYHHAVHHGLEPLATFEEAIEAEPERLAGEVEQMLADETYYSFAHHHWPYLARGIYADHLERWLVHYPRSQVLILGSERFAADPAQTFRRVLAFLGLPPWQPRSFGSHNAARYCAMSPPTRARLQAYFAPHNERLFDLLDERFDWG